MGEGLAGQVVQVVAQPAVRSALPELIPQGCPRKPSRAAAVRDDVSDGLAAHGQRHALTGAHRVDDAPGVVASPRTPMSMCDRISQVATSV